MRFLLTSSMMVGTMMAGFALPVLSGSAPVAAQSASDPASDPADDPANSATSAASLNPSLFSASALPALRGSTDIAAPGAAVPATYSSATTNYPVVPALPAEPRMAEQGLRSQTEELGDYDPDGIRAGAFLLYPSLSLFGTVTDNVDNDKRRTAGQFGTFEAAISAQSQWDRHSLELNGRVGVTGYQKPKRKPENEQSIDGELVLELSDQTDLTLTGSAQRTKEEESSIELITSGSLASIETTLRGGAKIDHDAGLTQLQLRGSVDNADYEGDPTRDYTTFTLGGRVGLKATDQVTPFVDVEASRKIYDRGPNSEDGDSLHGAIGIAITEREKLSGEVSVGAMNWRPEQKGRKEDTILFADASVTWSPNALWSLTGGLETSLTSTSVAANSVSTHTVSFGADYAARRNLTIGLDSSLSRNIYRGSSMKDWEYDATLSAEYALSRYTKLVVNATHEGREGNFANSDYHANKLKLGVTFQR